MQKYLKNNNKGFTLVEVIVVAVIVLILAAVAIPLYNGYIRDSRQASLENVAGSIASTLGAAYQKSIPVDNVNVTAPTATANGLIWVGGTEAAPENQVLIPKGMSGSVTADGVINVDYNPTINGVDGVTANYLSAGTNDGYAFTW